MVTELLDFEEYRTRFQHLRLERRGAVLEIILHSDGDSLKWGGGPQLELSKAFRFIAADRSHKVVILSGTGNAWTLPPVTAEEVQFRRTPDRYDVAIWTGVQLQLALLDINVPVIAAVNGPVYRHVELPLMCDIVLAAETATFDDRGHFPVNLVAGDGVFAATSLLMGYNRARYFHLMGQVLDARQAQDLGLVAEVLPADGVLDRAREIANELAAKPTLTLRYQRSIFTQPLKRRILADTGHSLALEGMAASSSEMPAPPREGMSSTIY